MTKKKKIIVIEDDELLADLCLTKLSEAGYEVKVAINGEEGLKKIREEKPDLALLDIILPDIDGFEILRQLKEDSSTASVPIIFLSNLGGEDDIKKGLDLGADDYLVKSNFTPGEIVEKVEQLILTKGDK